MLRLLKGLKGLRRMSFAEVLSDVPTREEVVTYFLAMLELLKLGQMHVIQDGIGGEITLIHGPAPTDEEDADE